MRCKFLEYSYENHEYITDVNYHGPVSHTKAILPHLINNKSGQLVVISSVAALLTPGLRTSYGASKAAVSAFYSSLRTEVRDYGISVTNVYPGYVSTNLSKNALVGGKGQTFSKTDTNISNGLTTEAFCKECLYGIENKFNDLVIDNSFKSRLGIGLKPFLPDLVHYLTYKNVKD